MPTFYAAGAKAQLSIASVDSTSTRNPLYNKNPESTRVLEGTKQAFAYTIGNDTLAERSLHTGTDPCALQYLGRNRDMPFLNFRAEKPSYLKNTPNSNPLDQEPEALCITISLGSKAFLAPSGSPQRGGETYELKIDVFYNGDLAESRLVRTPSRHDLVAGTEQILQFTGKRLLRMIEKPFILTPPSSRSSDGTVPAIQRWQTVSSRLLAKSGAFGYNGRGQRPLFSQYLESLAALDPSSSSLDQFQDQRIGIIDVVVTFGAGAKFGANSSFITEPTPLQLTGFAVPSQPAQGVGEASTPSQIRRNAPSQLQHGISSISGPSQTPNASSGVPAASSRGPPAPTSHPHNTAHLNSYLEQSNTPAHQTALAQLHISSPFLQTALPGQTEAPPRFINPASPEWAQISLNPATFGHPPRPPPSIPSGPGLGPILPNRDTVITPLPPVPESSNSARPRPARQPARPRMWVKLAYPPTLRNAIAVAFPPSGRHHRSDILFVPDELSASGRLGYAEEGIVRNVATARSGWFDEHGILVGFRYVI